MNDYTTQYKAQRKNARARKIPFLLTYEEWLQVWTESGHLEERGRLAHQYVMSRVGDVGPYAVGNVFIQTSSQNSKDAAHPQTPETRAKISATKQARKQPSRRKPKILHPLTPEQKEAARKKQAATMVAKWAAKRAAGWQMAKMVGRDESEEVQLRRKIKNDKKRAEREAARSLTDPTR